MPGEVCAIATTIDPYNDFAVAVLIPCRNEEASVAKVVGDFRRILPHASIFVYDNGSTDRTAERGKAAGAIVRTERVAGKGNVVRRMFADVDADVYVLVDGDDTYDAESCPALIGLLIDQQLDMVNAARHSTDRSAYPRGHRFGNALLSGLVQAVFGRDIKDLLSGYRVLSRRFVKSFPALSAGFEIETELTVHALELRLPTSEISSPYRARGDESVRKIKTVQDGLRILKMIVYLIRNERPFAFFTALALMFSGSSLVLAWPIFVEYLATGLVPRLPTAVLATGLMLLAALAFACGLVLDTITLGRREIKRLQYLSTPVKSSRPPGSPERSHPN